MTRAVLLVLLLTGCQLAPHAMRFEVEHVSHPGVGWPTGASNEEDALSQLSALLVWQNGAWYAESGFGYKLEDSGMYGPPFTFTARIGREWGLR